MRRIYLCLIIALTAMSAACDRRPPAPQPNDNGEVVVSVNYDVRAMPAIKAAGFSEYNWHFEHANMDRTGEPKLRGTHRVTFKLEEAGAAISYDEAVEMLRHRKVLRPATPRELAAYKAERADDANGFPVVCLYEVQVPDQATLIPYIGGPKGDRELRGTERNHIFSADCRFLAVVKVE